MNIGHRIRQERDRIGLTQEQFAAIGGATKRSQLGWEQGTALPNAAVLAAWAAKGADVLYIVTGKRGLAIDVTVLGMCDSALREAYVTLRHTEAGEIKISTLVKVYNAVIGKIGPDSNQTPIVRDVVQGYMEFADNPDDPDALGRALFREQQSISLPASATTSVSKSRGVIVAGGDVKVHKRSG